MDSKNEIPDQNPSNIRLYKFTKIVERIIIIFFLTFGLNNSINSWFKTHRGENAWIGSPIYGYVIYALQILLLLSLPTYFIMTIILRAKGIELADKNQSISSLFKKLNPAAFFRKKPLFLSLSIIVVAVICISGIIGPLKQSAIWRSIVFITIGLSIVLIDIVILGGVFFIRKNLPDTIFAASAKRMRNANYAKFLRDLVVGAGWALAIGVIVGTGNILLNLLSWKDWGAFSGAGSDSIRTGFIITGIFIPLWLVYYFVVIAPRVRKEDI